MKVNNEQFEDYKLYVEKFTRLLGLTEWKIYFKHHCEANEVFAEVATDILGMVASFRLANKLPNHCSQDLDIKRSALHESLHLLLTPLRDLATKRFVTEDQIIQADEAIVNRLMCALSNWLVANEDINNENIK